MTQALANKTALVVGGSTGIGRAVAELAARQGATIVIASRHAKSAAETLYPHLGTMARFYDVDIALGADRASLVATLDTIDHLIFTVRPGCEPAAFLDTNPQAAMAAFNVKYWGVYEMIQAIHPRMAHNGSITLTSGIAGEKTYSGASSMAVINSATETLCRHLAVELAPLRVNAVSPGFVAPKNAAIEARASQFPQGRLATVEEVAQAYIELMTSHYRTGTVSIIDGGARLL